MTHKVRTFVLRKKYGRLTGIVIVQPDTTKMNYKYKQKENLKHSHPRYINYKCCRKNSRLSSSNGRSTAILQQLTQIKTNASWTILRNILFLTGNYNQTRHFCQISRHFGLFHSEYLEFFNSS